MPRSCRDGPPGRLYEVSPVKAKKQTFVQLCYGEQKIEARRLKIEDFTFPSSSLHRPSSIFRLFSVPPWLDFVSTIARLSVLIALVLLVSSGGSVCAQENNANFSRHYQRGLELLKENRLQEAREELLESLRLNPNRADVHNTVGSIYDRLGQTDEAIRHFLRAIELGPRSPAIFNNLGIAYLRENQSASALEAFRRALKLDPENLSSHYNLGLLYLRDRRYTEAVLHLEKVLRESPGDLGILFNLGTAYLEQGKPEACLRLLDAVPREGPASRIPEIQLLFGMALARMNRLDEAIVSLNEAIRLRPESPEAYYRLGLVFQKKNEWPTAREYLEKAAELNPASPAEYFLALGDVYRSLGLTGEAIDAFKKSLAKHDSALAHLGLGSVFLETRRYDEATSEFEHAATKNPSSHEAVLNLALALHRAGKNARALERLRSLETNPAFKGTRLYFQVLSSVTARLSQWGLALDALKKASELEPKATELYFQMGLLLLNAGSTQGATDLLSRVAERFPDSATIRVGLAQAYIAGDRLDLAEEHLHQATRVSPDYDEPYYLLGNCYQDSNRLDKAIAFYEKAIARNAQRADFHFSLGLAYLRQGDWDRALERFQKALDLEPSAEALYRIASIHIEKDTLAEAEAVLKKAIELEPNHVQSHYLLFRLYSRRGEKIAAEREMRTFESLKREEEVRRGKPDRPALKPVDYYLSALR